LTRQEWRDLAVAMSLANLLLLRAWAALLSPANHYLLGGPPNSMAVLATIAGVFLLAAVLFGGARAVRRHAVTGALRILVALAFLAACVVVLNILRQQLAMLSLDNLYAALGTTGVVIGSSLLVGIAGVAVGRWGVEALARGAAWLVLAAMPLLALNIGRALLLAIKPEAVRATFGDQAPAERRSETGLPVRVAFVVFDSLDQYLLEEGRPQDLILPSFDDLFGRAVRWDDAYPPSRSTLLSMPSLITGRAVGAARPTAANELELNYVDTHEKVPWSSAPNMFSRAGELGGDSALIGWYHPYCRVLGRSLLSCRSYPYSPDPEHPLVESIRAMPTLIADSVPGVFRLRGGERQPSSWPSRQPDPRWHQHLYQEIHAETLHAVADPALALVFAHYPVPHEPGIYDRGSRTLTTSGATYLDNLALTDRALGELQRAVTDAGLGFKTALLVTADHAQRRRGDEGRAFPELGRPQHRVPLILALPGQTRAYVRHETARNLIAAGLAVAILSGHLRVPDDLDAALARFAPPQSSP